MCGLARRRASRVGARRAGSTVACPDRGAEVVMARRSCASCSTVRLDTWGRGGLTGVSVCCLARARGRERCMWIVVPRVWSVEYRARFLFGQNKIQKYRNTISADTPHPLCRMHAPGLLKSKVVLEPLCPDSVLRSSAVTATRHKLHARTPLSEPGTRTPASCADMHGRHQERRLTASRTIVAIATRQERRSSIAVDDHAL